MILRRWSMPRRPSACSRQNQLPLGQTPNMASSPRLKHRCRHKCSPTNQYTPLLQCLYSTEQNRLVISYCLKRSGHMYRPGWRSQISCSCLPYPAAWVSVSWCPFQVASMWATGWILWGRRRRTIAGAGGSVISFWRTQNIASCYWLLEEGCLRSHTVSDQRPVQSLIAAGFHCVNSDVEIP